MITREKLYDAGDQLEVWLWGMIWGIVITIMTLGFYEWLKGWTN